MKSLLTLAFWVLLLLKGNAQLEDTSALYKTILKQDSLLFNIGFNTCNLKIFENSLSADFEFMHDKDGILSKEGFINAFKNGLCNSPETYQSRRELIPESTEIYPLYNNNILYGAIQTGSHRFYEKSKNQQETFASTAKFTHVWNVEKGEWKLKRSLSFNHISANNKQKSTQHFNDNNKIEEWLKELNIPTVGIGVIKAGKLQEVKVYGELKKGIVAPYNTLFNVASLTKPITATVALILVSQGKWNLDEPIYKYWIDPDIAIDSNLKDLTTRHILSHQTGFTNWRGNSKDGKLHFEFAPGTKYQYSGEGFEYLRKALEQKFKQPLNQLATDLVFTKLGMSDTKYYWDNHTDSSRFAIGYNTQGSPYKTNKNKTANGADDLLTTIEDYGNFLVSILKGNHLTKQLKDEMVSFQVKTKKDKYFGLGFEIYDFGNKEYAISHGGSDMGCNTIFFILPKTKEGLVIFTNVDDGYKIYEKLLFQYLPKYASKIIEIETK